MKRLEGAEFDPFRIPFPAGVMIMNPGAKQDANNGVFIFPIIPNPDTAQKLGKEIDKPYVFLRVIASAGGGWDHASVSAMNPDGTIRQPRWGEMEWVKRKLFKDTEVAMQLHPAMDNYININPNVLHIWRPRYKSIPLPPKNYV
jgi:hypothetical protein